jgi:S1-C subfamily serine protease
MLRTNHDRKYALTLLIVAAGILAIGILLRPARTEGKKTVVDLERLQQMTQQRRLRDLSSYLTNAADIVASSLVYLDRPGSSGVVWGSRDEVLAPRRATVPFAIVTAKEPSAVIPVYRASAPPMAGEWVLAVAKNRDQQIVFAHGLYQGRAEARCGSFAYDEIQSSAPLSRALVGGGLFTLEGQILGFVGTCGDRPTVIAASTIAEFLRKPVTLNDRLEADYGLRVSPSGESVQVAAVWGRSAGDSAGFEPGDLLRTLDGVEITSLSDLGPLETRADDDHEIEVQRGRRRRTLHLLASQPQVPPTATQAGMTLGPGATDRDVTVLAVSPQSPAQRAGILPGDVLRRIGSDAVVDRGRAARILNDRNGRPVVLSVVRDGQELEVLLTP